MINIYEINETNYNNNGLATLIPLQCEFMPNINSGWSFKMTHPFDPEKRYMELQKNRILRVTKITCIREWQNTTQYFRIYDVKRNLTSVTVIAFPMGLEATYDVPIEELSIDECTGVQAVATINEYIDNNKYNLTCEVTNRSSSQYENTNLIALLSGDKDNSFVNRWGGEIAYDNYKIMIKNKLGDQNPTTLYPVRYGRNLVGIDHDEDMSSVITRIYPISNDGLRLHAWEDVQAPIPAGNSYVDTETTGLNYPFIRCAFIETNYKLIDTDDNSNTLAAQNTRLWREDMTNAIHDVAEELWKTVKNDNSNYYNPYYLQELFSGEKTITKYLQDKFSYTHKGWQSLVKSCAKEGVVWIKDEDLGEAKWLHLQGYWYGTTTTGGARNYFQVSNYLYIYGDSKWYYFDELGMMSTDEIPQEKIDELNSYTWHYVEGKGYWYGYDATHYIKNGWVEWDDNGTIKHYYMDDNGYVDITDTSTWSWSQEINGNQYGTDVNHIAINEYVLIDKVYEWFGADGFWQDWKRVELDGMGWYQTDDGKDWYGSVGRNYAHNEYVYTTEEGHMFETWLDNEGWVDENASGESQFGWHGSGTQTWFGEEGATASQKNKYIHDKWAYIDGTYYWFNSDGYISNEPDQAYQNWEWGLQTDEVSGRQWFGNEDPNYNRMWISNQWLQIEGIWYLFDSDGYKQDREVVKSNTIAWFANNVYNTVIDTIDGFLYDAENALYVAMIDWCNKQFNDGLDRPTVTIKVDLIDLSKTEEYKDYKALERVCLGDKVLIVDNLGNSYTERVVGLTYDCIRGYNTSVIVGELSKTVSQMLSTSYKGADHGGYIAGDNVVINGRVISVEDYVGRVVGMTDLLMNGQSVVSGNTGSFGIQAGENITITRSGNILTINGEGGGGLEYFHETQNSLYGQNTIDDELRRNRNYRFNHAVSARYNLHEPFSTWGDVQFDTINDNGEVVIAVTWERTIITSLWSQSTGEDNGIMVITTDPTVCGLNATDRTSIYQTLTASYVYGDFTDEQSHYDSIGGWATSTFTYEGTTYYVMLCHNNTYKDWSYEADSIKTIGSTLHYKDDRGIYSSVAEFALAVFTMNNTGQTISSYSGLHQGDDLAFFAGGSDSNGTDAPIKIFTDGTTEGLVTEEDLQDYAKIEDVPEIEANPSETPTDVLNSINIDGTAYEIQSGGGGSSGGAAYTEVVLWSDTNGATSPSNVTLIDDLSNYDAIYIVHASNVEPTYRSSQIIPVSSIDKTGANRFGVYDTGADSYYYTALTYTDDTHLVLDGWGSSYPIKYYKIVGIKYGGNLSPIIYSTEEREVGVWTDNKPLYAKTVTTGGSVPSGATLVYRQELSNKDCIYYTKDSDVAGSGEYNTLGIPNVHYDGNEKVIGTYFGETLYERTVNTGGSVPSGATLVNRIVMELKDTIQYIKS